MIVIEDQWSFTSVIASLCLRSCWRNLNITCSKSSSNQISSEILKVYLMVIFLSQRNCCFMTIDIHQSHVCLSRASACDIGALLNLQRFIIEPLFGLFLFWFVVQLIAFILVYGAILPSNMHIFGSASSMQWSFGQGITDVWSRHNRCNTSIPPNKS